MKKNLFNSHNLLMLVCVGVMVAAFFYLSGGSLPKNESGRSPLVLLLILLCPLMHIFMMRGMHGKSGDNKEEQKKDNCH